MTAFAYVRRQFRASQARRSREMIMMRISGGSRCAALIGLLGVSVGLSVFGCSAADSTPAPEAVDNLGAIGLALQAGGLTLSNVIYTIVGPAGFSKLGTIDVSASTQI